MAEKDLADALYAQYTNQVAYAAKASKKSRYKDRMWQANLTLDKYRGQQEYVDNLSAGNEQALAETQLLQDRASGAVEEFAFAQETSPDLQIEATATGAKRTAAEGLDNRRRRPSSVDVDPALGI